MEQVIQWNPGRRFAEKEVCLKRRFGPKMYKMKLENINIYI